MSTAIQTGTASETLRVWLRPPHVYYEMHHYGNDADGTALLHYCPTGFAMCNEEHDGYLCMDVIEVEGECRKWGEP